MACDGEKPEKPEKREKKRKIISRIPPFFCKTGRILGDGICKLLIVKLLQSKKSPEAGKTVERRRDFQVAPVVRDTAPEKAQAEKTGAHGAVL
jgi:hypothetical protein